MSGADAEATILELANRVLSNAYQFLVAGARMVPPRVSNVTIGRQ